LGLFPQQAQTHLSSSSRAGLEWEPVGHSAARPMRLAWLRRVAGSSSRSRPGGCLARRRPRLGCYSARRRPGQEAAHPRQGSRPPWPRSRPGGHPQRRRPGQDLVRAMGGAPTADAVAGGGRCPRSRLRRLRGCEHAAARDNQPEQGRGGPAHCVRRRRRAPRGPLPPSAAVPWCWAWTVGESRERSQAVFRCPIWAPRITV
jgi:hypothetical protein